jgi:two-component system, chemotaxis family, chemotaxis protein CheY
MGWATPRVTSFTRHMATAGWSKPTGFVVDSVLIADGDADTRLLFKTLLEPIANSISEAEDGAEALGKALAERPSLVVTETRLRRVDGFSLCSVLRRDPTTQASRILVVTSEAFPSDTARAIASGANAVLVKPCDPDDVIATVCRVCATPDGRATTAAAPEPTAGAAAAPARRMKSHTYQRHYTTTPPRVPPQLHCPGCDEKLAYVNSHVGGVSENFPEQWDYFSCDRCGAFCYRHRSRKLTAVR